MKHYIKEHAWIIEETDFDDQVNEISESIFSIGNGKMGLRANFEESYSGKSLEGHYVGGVYYPDKTRVGWWKNGYPEYFAKVINAPKWIGLDIKIDGKPLDLYLAKEIMEFRRVLDMRSGLLLRSFKIKMDENLTVQVVAERFVSMADGELGALKYTLSSNMPARLDLSSYLTTDVANRDSNYDEKFWIPGQNYASPSLTYVEATTKKTNYKLGVAATTKVISEGQEVVCEQHGQDEFTASQKYTMTLTQDPVVITKVAAVVSSFDHGQADLKHLSQKKLTEVSGKSFEDLKKDHSEVWEHLWNDCDIEIEGDIAAQQGIRFNIFHLLQTYTGKDARLNIGPKGFTGEKYGGVTYWDTEAYCIPFYLFTAGEEVARNLLVYRYNHLEKAIENAAKIGFKNGAALYPMVTMNGEECHNEWEITFEEIHRNGAIAYAIYDYIRVTGDKMYLVSHGLEVLIAISRFWAQRVNWSAAKNAYVMLGVTGPNEYENNVNNNWYTNYIAKWCLKYTSSMIKEVSRDHKSTWNSISTKLGFQAEEIEHWHEIINKIYLPYDEEKQVFLQQDGFLDKDLAPASAIPVQERPINQHWSWDRILRSCYIKQADVLQGLHFFENHFDDETVARNFDFYEPMTVHESSLSPCVHVILASRIGRLGKAYELYQRTARLDLNDYNNDTEDGLHITSMAGTWMSIVKGFGGLKVVDGQLHIQPALPENWKSYSFKVKFRNNVVAVKVSPEEVEISNLKGNNLDIWLNNHKFEVPQESTIVSAVSQFSNIKSSAS
ncbi:MAG: glycoside hydrolase family 65 protein [Saprospiraceae bacterium]|nr:glycoside hydrolase family 65 protein [Saprospiraceae bacterium]